MLTRVLLTARQSVLQHFRRNIGMTAVVYQAAAPKVDPIQQLFLDKVREYSKKQKTAGGGLVDASPAETKGLQDEMDKLTKQYGASAADFLKFPAFSFSEPALEPVGVSIEARQEVDAEVESSGDDSESREDKPYWLA